MSEATTRPPLDVTIHAYCEGYLIEVPLSLPVERIAEACKRLKAAGLEPQVAQAQGSQRPVEARSARPVVQSKRVRPEYNSDGTPVCPEHGSELREGQCGLFCSSKGGTNVNAKGYCNLRFEE